MARMGKQERKEILVSRVHKVHLVLMVVEWSTPGGEGQPAQTHQQLNWSMKEELVEATTITKEEELTISACQKYQTIYIYMYTTCRSLQELVDMQGYIYGSEYETTSSPLSTVHDHNVTCAVCYAASRGTVLMLPAKSECPSS